MIVGGHETTSATLTWIFYELGNNPEILEKLLKEVDEVTLNGSLSYDGLNKLVYTKMVIQETMRLHPAFWFENRNTIQNVELGGQRIPKGTLIGMSRYALHRNAQYWDNPEMFDPDRFSPDRIEGNDHPHVKGTYLPFSSGPRSCVGRYFAIMEITVILCTILKHYTFNLAPSFKFDNSFKMTLELKNGLPITLKKR